MVPLSSGRGTVSQKSIPLYQLMENIAKEQKNGKKRERMEKKKKNKNHVTEKVRVSIERGRS